MKRREFLRSLAAASPLVLGGCCLFPERKDPALSDHRDDLGETQALSAPSPQKAGVHISPHQSRSDHFNDVFPDDLFIVGDRFDLLKGLTQKFKWAQNHVGFGNFNLLGMDELIRLTSSASGALALTTREKLFLEEIFHFEAKKYGFNGSKVFHRFTEVAPRSEVVKIAGTGHYLKTGEPLELYRKLRSDVGDSLVLTSGFRGIAKQFHLFFEKTIESDGNLSMASRSLAPPGYSFHGRGDFDVGKTGYGLKNFTQDFSRTDEYKRLMDLGYVDIRYTQSNLLGVRFEPWHIKIES